MNTNPININDIEQALSRISLYIKRTPVVSSSLLNTWLGHNIYFKMECLQTTGAFKLRGASNFIAKLIENDKKPKRIVANSSGNHAQAVAYAAKQFNIPVTIFSTKNISTVKAAATRYYGASLKLFDTRPEADKAVKVASQEEGSVWIPPFNHPDIIAGQGTAAYEALQEIKNPDAIFAPCGGGGLVSGTLISARALSEHTKVIGVEPLQANDAAQSLRKGHIVSLTQTPATLADGAATPSVGEHTFRFLQELDDFVEVNEHDIAYWTQWLQHLLKMHIEPTCAMPMQAVFEYLKAYKESGNDAKQTVVVIISGGNISAQSMQKVWSHDHLDKVPQL